MASHPGSAACRAAVTRPVRAAPAG